MSKKLKIDTIILEGIDKTGKDTIQQYIYRLKKGRYAVYNRGNISNAAYDKIFNRNDILNVICLIIFYIYFLLLIQKI